MVYITTKHFVEVITDPLRYLSEQTQLDVNIYRFTIYPVFYKAGFIWRIWLLSKRLKFYLRYRLTKLLTRKIQTSFQFCVKFRFEKVCTDLHGTSY